MLVLNYHWGRIASDRRYKGYVREGRASGGLRIVNARDEAPMDSLGARARLKTLVLSLIKNKK